MMKESFLTLKGPGQDELTVKKSRFIGQAWPCGTEDDALAHLRQAREETRDARHHCYAYIIGGNEGILRYSDDGEPGGTAGMPMLSFLRSRKLVNCCAVVTRYFGGTLLGTGGLVRAYTEACHIAVNAAGIVCMENTSVDYCEVPYSCWEQVKYSLERLPARFEDLSFGTAVSFSLLTRIADRDTVIDTLHGLLGSSLELLHEGERFEAWDAEPSENG